MHRDDSRAPSTGLPDRALWQRSRATDAAVDDAERLLDLAAFADGRLDEDDRERVAALLAGEPALAGDVAIACRLAAQPTEAAPQAIVARAIGLVPAGGTIILFVRRSQPRLPAVARWSGLAAAMAVAGWLGFTLGMDASLTLAQIRQPGDDGLLRELVDPAPGFLREFAEGAQT